MHDPDDARGPDTSLAERHLRFGWWLLALAILAGTALEALHAFKLGLYLDVSNETRRLLWTLAHAHAALLGLVNVAFASTLPRLGRLGERGREGASRALIGGSVLLPAGFGLGGITIHGGDPGLGIVLSPVGALLLLIAVVTTARGVGSD